MKKILLIVALIFAFAKYECAQNAAAPQQEQQQQIPNTITIGNVILKFENNKWYKIQDQANTLLTIEDLYNILGTIDKGDVLFKIDGMIEIQSNYGGEIIDNTENKLIKHMIEHGHLGYVPLIAHEKTDYPLRYETLIPRSYFVITKDIKNEYLKYLDFLYKVLPDIHNHPIIYKTQIRNPITKENECWHANIEQKLYERGQQIISIVRRNYTVRHMIPAQVDEGKGIKRIQSINMILAPTSQAYRIAGKYFNEKAPTAVHETNHIMLYVRLEKTKKNQTTQKNILVLKSMFPWTNH